MPIVPFISYANADTQKKDIPLGLALLRQAQRLDDNRKKLVFTDELT